MKLHVVSRFWLWDSRSTDDLKENLYLPASVPALLALEKAGWPRVTTSAVLSAEVYQRVWRESLQAVWNMLQDALKRDAPGQPNLLLIHSYSLFLLIAEIRVFSSFLDRCLERYSVDEIHLEETAGLDPEPYLFYSALYSPYYHEVAKHWAERRGVRVVEMKNSCPPVVRAPSLVAHASEGQRVWRIPRTMAKIGFRRFRRELEAQFWSLAKNILSFLRGQRRFIFYLPSVGGGTTDHIPGFAVPAAHRMNRLWNRPPPSDPEHIQALLEETWGLILRHTTDGFHDVRLLIQHRWQSHLVKNYPKGMNVFYGFSRLLKRLSRWKIEAAHLAGGLFVDWEGQGYLTEAFRKKGLPTGSLQHGGNSRLVKRGGVPSLLCEYMGDFFFQWGKADQDEHAHYGIDYPTRFVRTGSLRTAELLTKSRGSLKSRGRKATILYAPTTFNLVTTLGNNMAWDHSIKVFQQVCALLNESSHQGYVKLMNGPEISAFDFSSYPRLRFLKRGDFSDYVGMADYLVVDSLGGSPLYESLATGKPILLYAGIENQEWDAQFLARLKESVVCFFDTQSYLKGVREFLSEPMAYIEKARLRPADTLVRDYLPPASPEKFWATVRTNFFESAQGAR